MCRSNHKGAPPPQRSEGGSAGAGEHHAEERWGGSPPCCSPRGLLPCCAPLRCALAGGGGMHGRADKSGRLSWWSLAWGSDARHGGALAVAAHGEARKSRCSRQTHVGQYPRTSRCCQRCQRGQLEAQKATELRLVTPRHPRVHANLHYSGWNALPVCSGDTACGRRPRCFASGSCEGTLLQNAFLSAFNTLSVSTHVPRGCHGGRRPWRRLVSRAGNSRSAPPHGALAPNPKSIRISIYILVYIY